MERAISVMITAAVLLGGVLLYIAVSLIALVMYLFVTFTSAQPHSHDDAVGRAYDKWMIPGTRTHSCCNKTDCAPTEVIIGKDGRLYARNHKMAPGRDIYLPPHLFEHRQPDPYEIPGDQHHVCMRPAGGWPPSFEPRPVCVRLATGT